MSMDVDCGWFLYVCNILPNEFGRDALYVYWRLEKTLMFYLNVKLLRLQNDHGWRQRFLRMQSDRQNVMSDTLL